MHILFSFVNIFLQLLLKNNNNYNSTMLHAIPQPGTKTDFYPPVITYSHIEPRHCITLCIFNKLISKFLFRLLPLAYKCLAAAPATRTNMHV